MIENRNISRSALVDNLKNKNKTFYYSSITSAIEENKKKMAETINSMIFKHKKFDQEVSSVDSYNPPVYIINYSKNKKPVISHFLKSMSIYNKIINGTFVYFSSSIGYFFNKKNNKQIKNTYKFLFYCFKTMFCLISKPVFIYKTDKIIIQLFYFVIFPYFFKNWYNSSKFQKHYRYRYISPFNKKKNMKRNLFLKKYKERKLLQVVKTLKPRLYGFMTNWGRPVPKEFNMTDKFIARLGKFQKHYRYRYISPFNKKKIW